MAHILEPAKQEGGLFGKTILIVENDPSNAEVLHLLLHLVYASYHVTGFRTAEEVLANLEVIQSLHPALFLLDNHPMAALDLYEHIHAAEGLAHVPAIILSTKPMDDAEKERASHLGMLFVPKPYDIDDLLAMVKQALS